MATVKPLNKPGGNKNFSKAQNLGKDKSPKVAPLPPLPPAKSFFFLKFNYKLIALAVITLIFYGNTILNQYALDDGIVIEENAYVQNGIAGIGKIMTTDAYDSYYKKMNAGQQLSGGRYRPLSEVIFAIEHTILGESNTNSIATARHFFSIICYVMCVLVIFYFLAKYLFARLRYGEDLAFLSTLLFAIHPIHTEAVANVKSLDEILSALFIFLTFIFCLRYIDFKKTNDLVFGCLSYFLALLAKEYAILLVLLLPMVIYLLRYRNFENLIVVCLPYLGVFIIYLFFRGYAVGFHGHVYTGVPEILDDPYLLATHAQKAATEYYVLMKYLGLLIYPYPLVSDYSYNQIPYKNFANPIVLFSIVFTIGLFIIGFILLRKKSILAFPVFFYLLNLLLVSNLFMDIGATMGERLIFHSSIGFTIMLSYGIFKLMEKSKMFIKTPRVASMLLIGLCSALCVACGDETIKRNAEWKNDVTLFTHDVLVGPNSIMLNGNAGARYVDLGQKAAQAKDTARSRRLIDSAITYLRKSIALHKRGYYIASYVNMGDAYFQLHEPDSVKVYWDLVSKNYPDYPGLNIYDSILAEMYLSAGEQFGKVNNYPAAIAEIKKAVYTFPRNSELWYNLGGAYFSAKYYDSAYMMWQQTLKINPNNVQARKGLSVLMPVKKKGK